MPSGIAKDGIIRLATTEGAVVDTVKSDEADCLDAVVCATLVAGVVLDQAAENAGLVAFVRALTTDERLLTWPDERHSAKAV